MSTDDEKQIPLPPVTIANTGPLSRDVVVSGVFTGSIRGSASPEGTLEVGYEVACGKVPGMMASLALAEQTSWNISVTEKKFTGPNPKVEISGYHIVINRCPGLAFIRSYAIIAAYSQPDRRRGKTMMTKIIDALRRGVPPRWRKSPSSAAPCTVGATTCWPTSTTTPPTDPPKRSTAVWKRYAEMPSDSATSPTTESAHSCTAATSSNRSMHSKTGRATNGRSTRRVGNPRSTHSFSTPALNRAVDSCSTRSSRDQYSQWVPATSNPRFQSRCGLGRVLTRAASSGRWGAPTPRPGSSGDVRLDSPKSRQVRSRYVRRCRSVAWARAVSARPVGGDVRPPTS